MNSFRTKIFFAIPCGEFFTIQNQIIKTVCNSFGIDPIIIEDHSRTDSLWNKITKAIDESDFFVADISSNSPNIILELGYTIREKKPKYYAIFASANVKVPVDLQGFTLQKYSSFNDFQNKLIKWIKDNIALTKNTNLDQANLNTDLPTEDFNDIDRFLRLWTNPPLASFYLTHEGLRFTNTHFPIMTNYLGLLKNYEFEFQAKIIQGAIGWIVKGTKSSRSILPEFCIMFNIDAQNALTPHIFNLEKPIKDVGYHVFHQKQVMVNLVKSKQNWFTIVTRVVEDKISILNNDNLLFEANFTEEPFKDAYSYQYKQGEVGFRCHPGEEAVVRYMKVREI